ncbi:MAG: hypothetical protein QM808_17350 [Steroidobacteraceae bacterium]
MRIVMLIALSLCAAVCSAETRVVIAVIEAIAQESFPVKQRPECNSPNAEGEDVICTAGWERHRLTRVTALDGSPLPDTIALILIDLRANGPKLLELQPLTEEEARLYGATYQALRSTTLFSGACLSNPLPAVEQDRVIGPTKIEEFGDASCYLLPLWWAR